MYKMTPIHQLSSENIHYAHMATTFKSAQKHSLPPSPSVPRDNAVLLQAIDDMDLNTMRKLSKRFAPLYLQLWRLVFGRFWFTGTPVTWSMASW